MTQYAPLKLAPILVSVYDRDVHFKKCIESLETNKYADQSPLYIAIDAPLREEHKAANDRIVAYANALKGFKDVTIFRRETNIGSWKNIWLAMNTVFERHDRMIFFEDDNVFQPNFLSFVNEGLDAYKDREDIFSVTGFNPPIEIPKMYKYDVYMRPSFSAWGVGLWKKKFEEVDWSMRKFNDFVGNKANFARCARMFERNIGLIRTMRTTGAIIGDAFLVVHMHMRGMYSVYPVLSRVRNIGHDGSGEHGGVSSKFLVQKICEGWEEAAFPPDLKPDPKVTKVVLRSFRYSPKERTMRALKTAGRPIKRWLSGHLRRQGPGENAGGNGL